MEPCAALPKNYNEGNGHCQNCADDLERLGQSQSVVRGECLRRILGTILILSCRSSARGVPRRRLCRCFGTKSVGVNTRGAAYVPKFLHRRHRHITMTMTTLHALQTLHIFVFLCIAFTSGNRIAPQPPSLRTRPQDPLKPKPPLRFRRSALKLPAHAMLVPHEGDARYLVYLHLEVNIGVARPEMVELGEQACEGKRWWLNGVVKIYSAERFMEEEMIFGCLGCL